MAEGQKNFTNVEHGHIIAKSAIFPESVEEFASWTVFEDHVDEGVILEGGFQRVNKRMIQLHQDLFLHLDVLDLLQVYYMAFRQLLQGQHLVVGSDNLFDSSKSARSQSIHHLVLGDVLGVPGLSGGSLFDPVLWIGLGRLFLLPLSLQLFQLGEEKVELLGVHFDFQIILLDSHIYRLYAQK